MNKGSKFINQIMSAYQKALSRNADMRSETNNSINPQPSSNQTNSQEQKIVVHKKEKHFLRRIYQVTPSLNNNHIFKLYGFLGINEAALQNPNFSESHYYSHLQSRVIQKIEFYDHAILIQLTEPIIPLNQPCVEYLIQRYMSKGDAKFYELALIIQELSQLLKLSNQGLQLEQKNESVKKWLDFLGDQMYATSIGSRKFAISKSLLTYLQYDLNEFAIQATKYRANFIELFSATNYGNIVKHLLNCLKYIVKCSLGQISLAEFKELTTYNFSDFIESKNNVRSFCDMTITMLNPSYCCHKINFIYYKESEKMMKQLKSTEGLLAIQDEKQRIRQDEYVTIKKLKTIPRHLFKQNQKLFASYKFVDTEDLQKGEKEDKN